MSIKTRLQLRHDVLSAWEKSTDKLFAGEIAFAENTDGTFTMKVGDGDKTWSQLSASPIVWTADQIIGLTDAISELSTTHYEKATREELNALSVSCKNGDTGVVKKEIGDGIYSYTAYVFDGALSAWKAMDGNYSAENVYFENDITAMYSFGKYSGTTAAPITINADGKNIATVFSEALTEIDQEPAIRKPSCSVSMSGSGNKEIGTVINSFTWSRSYTDGNYEFGRVGNTSVKSSGCELTASTLTCTKGLTDDSTALTATSGTAYLTEPVTMSIGTNTIAGMNLTCEYAASPHTPANNVGREATEADAIVAGSCTNSASLSQSGFRYNLFIGTTEQTKSSESLTSNFLKRVETGFNKIIETTATNDNLVTSDRSITVPVGAKTIIIAAYDPNNKMHLKQVLNTTVNADMTSSFEGTRYNGVVVNGASDAAAYQSKFTVWTYSPAEAYGSTANLTIKFTV